MSLFQGLKYYIIPNSVSEETHIDHLLTSNGGKKCDYLTTSVNLSISDNFEAPDVGYAKDIYDSAVVTSKWVKLSCQFNVRLPYGVFSPETSNLFKQLVFCPSQLSARDADTVWLLANAYGAECDPRLTSRTTHVISSTALGEKCSGSSRDVKVVAPDWLTASIEHGALMNEADYHPSKTSRPKVQQPPLVAAEVTPVTDRTAQEEAIESLVSSFRFEAQQIAQTSSVPTGHFPVPLASSFPSTEHDQQAAAAPPSSFPANVPFEQAPHFQQYNAAALQRAAQFAGQPGHAVLHQQQSSGSTVGVEPTSPLIPLDPSRFQGTILHSELVERPSSSASRSNSAAHFSPAAPTSSANSMLGISHASTPSPAGSGGRPISTGSSAAGVLLRHASTPGAMTSPAPIASSPLQQQQQQQYSAGPQQQPQQRFFPLDSSGVAPPYQTSVAVSAPSAPYQVQQQPNLVGSPPYATSQHQVMPAGEPGQPVSYTGAQQQHAYLQRTQSLDAQSGQFAAPHAQAGGFPPPQSYMQTPMTQGPSVYGAQQTQLYGQAPPQPISQQQHMMMQQQRSQMVLRGMQQQMAMPPGTVFQHSPGAGPSEAEMQQRMMLRGYNRPLAPPGHQLQQLGSREQQQMAMIQQQQQQQQQQQMAYRARMQQYHQMVGSPPGAGQQQQMMRYPQPPSPHQGPHPPQPMPQQLGHFAAGHGPGAPAPPAQLRPEYQQTPPSQQALMQQQYQQHYQQQLSVQQQMSPLQPAGVSMSPGLKSPTSSGGPPSQRHSPAGALAHSATQQPMMQQHQQAPFGSAQQPVPLPPQPMQRVQLFGHDPRFTTSPDTCLVGCVFLIVEYERILDQKEVHDWRLAIVQHGGEVEASYSPRVTHIVCEGLRNQVVMQAPKDKRFVTAQWLNDCLLEKRMLPPWKAIHFPTHYNENKPCKDLLFCVSGFEGNDRNCLKQMIYAVGGKYTSYLCRKNFVVIARNLDGTKVAKAQEFNVPVVGVHWLTEILLGNTNAVAQPALPRYRPQTGGHDCFRLDLNHVPVHVLHLLQAWQVPVHVTQEIFQRSLARKHQLENDDGKVFAYKKLRLSPAPDEDSISAHRQTSPAGDPTVVLFTGLYKAETENLKRKLLFLGGNTTDDIEKCTHVVASDLKRTMKLLTAVSLGVPIIAPAWIRQSYKQQRLLDCRDFAVKDEGNEKFFGFNLRLSLRQARRKKLFEDILFYLTPDISPGRANLRYLIETAGGSVLAERPPSDKIAEYKQRGVNIVIITCDNDLHLCTNLLNHDIAVHSAEFVLTGILRQEVDYESYRIVPTVQPMKAFAPQQNGTGGVHAHK